MKRISMATMVLSFCRKGIRLCSKIFKIFSFLDSIWSFSFSVVASFIPSPPSTSDFPSLIFLWNRFKRSKSSSGDSLRREMEEMEWEKNDLDFGVFSTFFWQTREQKNVSRGWVDCVDNPLNRFLERN
eukprot:TRINITY_DN2084_c0_g1_i3.p2 TRINITY_DN2084_c0_g1~~TRINITY_DN2084_c0_g1_i3.p2  ORF type:complete len:128 (+),score=30.84 TRINITY_DN2084_c0_g1_i3:1630-2013(+)